MAPTLDTNYRLPIINTLRLLWNLLLVYVAYTVCRLLFLASNASLYSGTEASHIIELLQAGLVFDSSAICYTNILIIVLFLFPLHWKERTGYYKTVKWIYFIVNSLCIIANLCDVVYFPFTGKRTTGSVLQEFSNEGTAQMANIFYEHTVANWHLLLTGIVLIAMLWFGFMRAKGVQSAECRMQNGKEEVQSGSGKAKKMVGYYVVSLLTFGGLGYLSVGLMRGGFTTSTRPITISNANQYANTPAEAGAVLNTPFSIIRTFNKKPFVVPEYMSDEEALALYSPEHQPLADTERAIRCDSIGKSPNIVILIMESFSKQHIGFYNKKNNENGSKGDKVTFTPFLDNLIEQKALTFRYSYSNGRKSIEGMPSILSSIPNFVEPFILTPAAMNDISSLARELSENKGYTSAFFHGAENGSMGFEAYAHSCGFQKYYGLTEYCADEKYHGMRDFDGTWAIWDEEFLQFYCDRMSEMKQPFITSVFTATSHSPYDLPERYVGKFRKGKDPSQELVMYSDNALSLFFETASEQPWFNNTIFVITADHTSANVDAFYNSNLGHYSVPIIFYAPGLPELKGYDTQTIVQQIDIMPTLLGMIGYDKPYIAFGQDIFNTPRKDKFAIHWVPGPDYYEFIRGKYVMHFDGRGLVGIYKYKKDLLQKKNIITDLPTDSILRTECKQGDSIMRSIIQQYMQRMNGNRLRIKN